MTCLRFLLHNWPRWDLNPYTPLGIRDFKSRASAYSATRPGQVSDFQLRKKRHGCQLGVRASIGYVAGLMCDSNHTGGAEFLQSGVVDGEKAAQNIQRVFA